MTDCAACKATFEGTQHDIDLALKLCTDFPEGECEACSVGIDTAGAISEEESLLRILVDPRDFDDGTVAEAPFRTAFRNGLSVLRSKASDQDCLDQTQEGMYRKRPEDEPRQVVAVCEVAVGDLRAHFCSHGRSFSVYDQTVPRAHTTGGPIAGHAGVFGRVLPKGAEGRKVYEKDLAGELKRLFLQKMVPVAGFSSGLLISLNSRSAKGEFTVADEGI